MTILWTTIRRPNLRALSLALALAMPFVTSQTALALEASSDVKVATVLKTSTSWDGKPIEYPKGPAEITGMTIEIAPGGETGWHLHPVASFGMVTQGELHVHLKDGSVKKLKAGDAIAEVTNTLHNGRNVGTVPVKIVVFYAGTPGQALTVKETGH